jgi:hypothetical protein
MLATRPSPHRPRSRGMMVEWAVPTSALHQRIVEESRQREKKGS